MKLNIFQKSVLIIQKKSKKYCDNYKSFNLIFTLIIYFFKLKFVFPQSVTFQTISVRDKRFYGESDKIKKLSNEGTLISHI